MTHLSLLRRYLTEAAQYDDMFKDVLAAIPVEKEGLRRQISAKIKAVTTAARKALKKNDRIVWYLRLWRAGLIVDLQLDGSRLLLNLSKRMRCSTEEVMQEGHRLFSDTAGSLQMIAHFLSLPIPAITNHVFGFETVEQLSQQFKAAEKTWQENISSSFLPERGDKKLIEFPNGLAWWLLARGACSVEGEAMGHCGNLPSERSGDRILSLRQSFMVGDVERVKPYLTFILNGDGKIGEMKGRFNHSPKNAAKKGFAPSDFHQEIIALLKHPKVEGLRGGGYMPGENFSLNHLEPEQRDALLAEKPELAGFEYIREKHGDDSQEVVDAAYALLREHDIDPPHWDVVDNEIVVGEWSDLGDFCRSSDDEIMNYLLTLLDDNFGGGSVTELEYSDIINVLEHVPDHALKILCQRSGISHKPAHDAVGFNRMIRQLAALPDVRQDLLEFARGSSAERALRNRITEYIECGWRFEISECYLHVEKAGEQYNLDAPVTLRLTRRSLLDYIVNYESDPEGEEMESNDLVKLKGNSEYWDTLDQNYSHSEWRGRYSDYDLTDENGDDKLYGSKRRPRHKMADGGTNLVALAKEYGDILDGTSQHPAEPGDTPRLFDSMRRFMNMIR